MANLPNIPNIPDTDDIIEGAVKGYKKGIFYGKRLVFAIAIVIGLLVIAWFWITTRPEEIVIKNYPSNGTTVVAFGDSLVEGVGANRTEGFVKILQDRTGVPIYNFGKAGDTTVDGIARVDEIVATRANIAIVLFGGNDVLKRISENDTFVNLQTIISRLQDAGMLVIVLGVPSGVFFDDFRDNFDALPRQMGALYVPDITEGWFDQPALKYDAIHPNDAGYEIIADKVEPVLRDALWGGKS